MADRHQTELARQEFPRITDAVLRPLCTDVVVTVCSHVGANLDDPSRGRRATW